MDRFLRAFLFVALAGALGAQNVITTIAGEDPSFAGNGQPALNVPIGYVNGVATDSAGNDLTNRRLNAR